MAPFHIDVELARTTRVVRQLNLLSAADIALVLDICNRVQASTSDPLHGNRQNEKHALSLKKCTFLDRQPPAVEHASPAAQHLRALLPPNPFRALAPRLLSRLLRFAERARVEEGWSAPGGPLAGISGGVEGLRVRVVEHWRYETGGHLGDPYHYDGGSVLTMIVPLNEGYTGGELLTSETDGRELVYALAMGEGACFVSHKYHSIRPVQDTGVRESLVIELWQGGTVSGRFDQG
jgi:hypothetical protein